MPYNSAADSFHTKKLCSRLSSREVRFQRKNDNNCENRLIFDEDKADKNGAIFGPPLIYTREL